MKISFGLVWLGIAAPIGIGLVDPTQARVTTIPIKAFLCDSADHAMLFADALAEGESAEGARARVARSAPADACGRYVGVAAIESQSVRLKGGVAYKLTAYLFTEDRREAWRAETTFAPAASEWDL